MEQEIAERAYLAGATAAWHDYQHKLGIPPSNMVTPTANSLQQMGIVSNPPGQVASPNPQHDPNSIVFGGGPGQQQQVISQQPQLQQPHIGSKKKKNAL